MATARGGEAVEHTCSATDRQFIRTAALNLASVGSSARDYLAGGARAEDVIAETRRASRMVERTAPTDPSLRRARLLVGAKFAAYGRAIEAREADADAGAHMQQAYGLAKSPRTSSARRRPSFASAAATSPACCDNGRVDVRERVERFIREHGLIEPGAEVVCLVSGGPDSTCLWHLLGELGYGVSALHVDHGLRGAESDEDARFCREALGAEVVDGRGGRTEEELRAIRYSFGADRLRATGHTASDQIETVLYRLVSSGQVGRAIEPRRADGVVRPLLGLWREETEAYCRDRGLAFRDDGSNRDSKRGLIRAEILPLLERLHPGARANLLRLADERPRLSPELAELLSSPAGSRRLDLGGGLQAVREYDRVWLEPGPVRLEGPVRWGPWTIESGRAGLMVRGWRAGDRLAGRSKKVQDVFVDAKIPRSERESWPLVVRGDEVVAIPGLVEHPDVKAVREE